MPDSRPDRILLAYYGDDFSGTTATAEALFESGVPTVIFTEAPQPGLLARNFPTVRAVGVAGLARTLPVREMEAALTPVFGAFRRYRPPVVLYKVCSTFDSSETTGSIGRAIEIGREIFAPDFVPLLPAAPRLGRYTAFGHHFAALGGGEVYRLDRHPSMSSHPVTPMRESDLRLHLGRQTSLKIGLVNLRELNRGRVRVRRLLRDLREGGTEAALFDCLEEKHLRLACRVVWERADPERPVFFVGSQEIGYGLGRAWRREGLLAAADAPPAAAPAEPRPILALSGSCATMTGRQIRRAVEDGFAEVRIAPEDLPDPDRRAAELDRVAAGCLRELVRGRSVIAHTAAGPEDPRIEALRASAAAHGLPAEAANRLVGDALGEIALRVLRDAPVRRLVVAGGDTAGRIQKHLRLRALQVARPVGLAAPLCYLYSGNPALNGLEVAFKGGQIGTDDYFGQVRAAPVRGFAAEALGRFPQP